MKKLTTDAFVERATAVHGRFYDYSQSVYASANEKVLIGCPKHGAFWQKPDAHVNARKGCPACRPEKAGLAKKLKTDDFLERAHRVHGSAYSYAQARCFGSGTEVEIICPIHGPFLQKACVHLRGHGCPACGNMKRNQPATTMQFVARARAVHGSFYGYSAVRYAGIEKPVWIDCPIHGAFSQEADSHLHGHGCPRCYQARAGDAVRLTAEDFVKRAFEAHGALYRYSLAEFRGSHSKITIICPLHGEFVQTAKLHLAGSGCPACYSGTSKGEKELFDWIKSLCPDAVSKDRTILGNLELDVAVPSCRVAVEYNGMYWHSDPPFDYTNRNRGCRKYRLAKDAHYTLFTVWEEDWKQKPEVVKHWLRHKLGRAEKLCGARETCTVLVTAREAVEFYEKFHLQGPPNSSARHFGLQFEGRLVAAMSLTRSAERGCGLPEGAFYLARMAFAGSIPGAATKLFKFGLKETGAKIIDAHSDNSYSDGRVNTVLGFVPAGTVKPCYRLWHYRHGIKHRSFWQKSKLAKRFSELGLLPCPEQSTAEGQAACGCRRIWDFGKIRWRYAAPTEFS